MVLVTVNLNEAYYSVVANSDQYFNDIIYDNIINFIHIAAFWKILDDMSKYDIYANLMQYKLEMLNFIDDAINCLAETIDISINDNTKMMMQLMKVINIDNISTQSEEICEPMLDSCIMCGIIYELLNRITLDDIDSSVDDLSILYDFIQSLKTINSEILINILQ